MPRATTWPAARSIVRQAVGGFDQRRLRPSDWPSCTHDPLLLDDGTIWAAPLAASGRGQPAAPHAPAGRVRGRTLKARTLCTKMAFCTPLHEAEVASPGICAGAHRCMPPLRMALRSSAGHVSRSTRSNSESGDSAKPEAIARLVEGFDPLRIVVFGAYARGDSRPDSDLDLLVAARLRATGSDQRISGLAASEPVACGVALPG